MALIANFQDDVLNTSVNTRRKYQMINNEDGTVSFTDVTSYTQKGTLFGAKEINEIINFINGIFDKHFPVGKVFISLDDTNPGEFLGGTWELFAKGETLVGVDTSQTEFATVEKHGGNKTHTLSVEEIPPHDHPSRVFPGSSSSMSGGGAEFSDGDSHSFLMTGQTGGGQPHNNLQPYVTCYIWKRVA